VWPYLPLCLEAACRDLVADVTLDERHPRRLVKCVTWQPRQSTRSSTTRGHTKTRTQSKSKESHAHSHHQPFEKFALKITMRGARDVHCKRVFTEKDVMLALAPSPWHAELVVRNLCSRHECVGHRSWTLLVGASARDAIIPRACVFFSFSSVSCVLGNLRLICFVIYA
jgi:hypothetical protein